MKKKEKRIAVILLNFNGEKLLQKFLPYIIKFNDFKISSIYLIDNKSSDKSVEICKKKFPEVTIIINKKNLGYAAGYNEGVKNIKADYFVFINTDVLVTKNWLIPLFNKMDSRERIMDSCCCR